MSTHKNVVEELKWRGLIQDMTPNIEEKLMKEPSVGYIGFDPTAPSLTVGNLVAAMLLVHLQRAGHTPIVLLGGATGMIGDPSGKSDERKLLSKEVLKENKARQKRQFEKLLHFDTSGNNAIFLDNYEWTSKFSLLEFLRDVGKHITISYMLNKDSVQNRLQSGLSFTEFSYQILQGYDFYYLNKHHKCVLQMGGADQWGNITTGIEFTRRMSNIEVGAITAPLLTKSDGTKFGKSESGNIWLDRTMTSPFRFYQFWINLSDEEAARYIKIFTLLNKEEIDRLIEQHQTNPSLRILQKKIAVELTSMIHSKEDVENAQNTTRLLFENGRIDFLENLPDEQIQEVFDGIPVAHVGAHQLKILELLADHSGIFKSRGEARKMIQNGGLSMNNEKVSQVDIELNKKDFINGKYLLVRKGKKKHYLIILQE